METSSSGYTRLLIGLLQGLALYFLYYSDAHKLWLSTHPMVMVPLTLVFFLLPGIIIVSLNHLNVKILTLWCLSLAALLAALSIYDVYRRADGGQYYSAVFPHIWAAFPSYGLICFAVVGLFIGQALMMSSVSDQHVIATYTRYFDVSWKIYVQLIFSLAFTAAFWLILYMGAELLGLIKITFLTELYKHEWFSIPATTVAFAYGLHITDVRANLTRGLRTLKLTLLSWLLPIITLFVSVFVVTLPLKGFNILMNTHHTSQILLGTSAWLILLVNAAYQDGTSEHLPAKVLQYSARLSALMLLPLVLIAIYAVLLRVDAFGWTVNIIDVFLCLIIALFYSVGYFRAGLARGPWLKNLERTNIYAAFLILGILIVIFSPLADPARLSVDDQMARLKSGKVSIDKFDFSYLKTKGEIYGVRALKELRDNASGPDADQIKKRIDTASGPVRWTPPNTTPLTVDDLTNNIIAYPEGQKLPDSFLKNIASALKADVSVYMGCINSKNMKCDAYIVDTTADKPQQIILAPKDFGDAILLKAEGDTWTFAGKFTPLINCKGTRDSLRLGQYKIMPSTIEELDVNGLHIPLVLNERCPENK